MTSQDKPVVCIVHGAWHRPLHYRLLIDALRSTGHTVVCPPLASSGYDDSIVNMTHTDDVARIHTALLPYLDEGRRAVIVSHSYGGIPANLAVEGQTEAERAARGLKGGIVGCVYIACLAAVEAQKYLIEQWGGEWLSLDLHRKPEEGKLPLHDIENSKKLFYNDIDEARRHEAATLLCDQASKPFYDPLPYVGQSIQVPKTYVLCLQDKCVPPDVQRIPAGVWGCKVVEVDAGHSPFLKDEAIPKLVEVIGNADKKE